jgi:hypothetical protein
MGVCAHFGYAGVAHVSHPSLSLMCIVLFFAGQSDAQQTSPPRQQQGSRLLDSWATATEGASSEPAPVDHDAMRRIGVDAPYAGAGAKYAPHQSAGSLEGTSPLSDAANGHSHLAMQAEPGGDMWNLQGDAFGQQSAMASMWGSGGGMAGANKESANQFYAGSATGQANGRAEQTAFGAKPGTTGKFLDAAGPAAFVMEGQREPSNGLDFSLDVTDSLFDFVPDPRVQSWLENIGLHVRTIPLSPLRTTVVLL